jgi:hypothetical protein
MEDVIAKKKPKVSPAGRRKKGLAFERVAAARLSKIRGVVAKRIPLNSPNAAIINCDLDINFRGARFTAECKAGGHAPSIDRYIGKNNFVISKETMKAHTYP